MGSRAASYVVIVGLISLAASLFVSSSLRAGPAEDATYVGASKCKKCHSKLLREWETTAHAKNFGLLALMGRDQDTECVRCHSTGYGEASGFVDLATTSSLAGTTCEACHGPGSEHIGYGKKAKERARASISVPTGTCVKCHEAHGKPPVEEMGKEVLPALKKKLEELQALIASIEAE